MWIRDALPAPGVRFILYGYDTALVCSRSIQSVEDLALSLTNALKAGAGAHLAQNLYSQPGRRCTMLAGSGAAEVAILERIKGANFFVS
jgi:hypothetical protein